MESLGRAIAKQRHLKGLSLREVAQLAKCSHQCVSLVEAGEAKLTTTLKVALAVGLRNEDVRYYAARDVGRMAASAA